jgi:hypothetical protein
VSLAALLLAAAAPQTAVDAERAFASEAQVDGQWAAFRRWAAPDGIMFVPQPTTAHEFLKGLPDPKLTYQWWPADAFVSCDGKTAVTTGPAVRGSYRGYFTTVWKKQADGGWRWLLDHGAPLDQPRAATDRPALRNASCADRASIPPVAKVSSAGARDGGGSSDDSSLIWSWKVLADGARTVAVNLWNGRSYELVLRDQVKAQP